MTKNTFREEQNKKMWGIVEFFYNSLREYLENTHPTEVSMDRVSSYKIRRLGYAVSQEHLEEFLVKCRDIKLYSPLLDNYATQEILDMVTNFHLIKLIVNPSFNKLPLLEVIEHLTGIYLKSYFKNTSYNNPMLHYEVKGRECLDCVSDYIKSTDILWWSSFLNPINTTEKLRKVFRVYNKIETLINNYCEDRGLQDNKDVCIKYAISIVGKEYLTTHNVRKMVPLIDRYANSLKDAKLIAKVFKNFCCNNLPVYSNTKDFREILMTKFSDASDEVFEKNKHLLDNRYKRITYKGFVEEYFKNKGYNFKFDTGISAPKLSTQLTKQEIPYTNREIISITEFKEWLFLSLLSKGNTEGYLQNDDQDNIPNFLVIDTEDFSIPYNVDNWAFHGSCNWSKSEAGSHTHLMLRQLGASYLKVYSYQEATIRGKETHKFLAPYARAYLYREGNDIAHAGTYTNGSETFKSNGYIVKNAYEATTFILCVLFGKNVSEFISISGTQISNDDYDTDNIDGLSTACVWSNMSDYCDYSKRGTKNILYNLYEDLVDWDEVQKDFVRKTLPARNQHDCIKLTEGK